MGGTTLAKGICSPTASLEWLRLLLSVLCRKKESVLSSGDGVGRHQDHTASLPFLVTLAFGLGLVPTNFVAQPAPLGAQELVLGGLVEGLVEWTASIVRGLVCLQGVFVGAGLAGRVACA